MGPNESGNWEICVYTDFRYESSPTGISRPPRWDELSKENGVVESRVDVENLTKMSNPGKTLLWNTSRQYLQLWLGHYYVWAPLCEIYIFSGDTDYGYAQVFNSASSLWLPEKAVWECVLRWAHWLNIWICCFIHSERTLMYIWPALLAGRKTHLAHCKPGQELHQCHAGPHQGAAIRGFGQKEVVR